MTSIQEFSKMLEVEASDHERSILLVDIMNAMGFSKNERQIHRHNAQLQNVLINIFPRIGKSTITLTGSTSEGLCSRFYVYQNPRDSDFLLTDRRIKLYTPRTSNTNNPPLLLLDANEEYDASFFVEEDDNFPGYVKLSFAEVKTNSLDLIHYTIMYENKLYLSNSMMMGSLYEELVKQMKGCIIRIKLDRSLDTWQQIYINGPAHTLHSKYNEGITKRVDLVYCIHYDMWPKSANSFITRRKPNNWPSNSILENIQSKGCDIAPVGHRDSENNDIQWRISFPGEQSLLLDFTEVQILCYVLIKIILKENLNTSQREVVSSFHIKHVMFWCVEGCSCQWVYSNYINCLNICLRKLLENINVRHIPHYIIKSRNLLNSKMTEKMSKEIVDVLSKYDTTHVFTLDAFEHVFRLTHFNNALLKRMSLKSTILSCFHADIAYFIFFAQWPSVLWNSYIPHNATTSLMNYVNIQKKLQKGKRVSSQYVMYLIKSMVGFLYYAKYKESNNSDFLLASKRLIQKSLNLDNSCVKLRAATFFLTNLEYSQSVEMCDTFINYLPTYNVEINYVKHIEDIMRKVCDQLFKGKTSDGIENIMKAILPMFSSSFKLKSLPGNYDVTRQSPVWIFRNFTNIVFHDVSLDVTFMTAEKWVVPDPILYELLSLPQNADNEESTFSGIHLDPIFVCRQTKFLCYHSMGNVNGMTNMLTLMNSFITENIFTTKSSCVYLNMFAYCQIKAGHHRQSVKYILQSLRSFPSRYNTVSGYLQIVLQILNSLSI